MSTKITCPVCDRSELEINICPNCQTDLTLLRMLTELPLLEPIDSSFQVPKWSVVGILFGFILLGWGLWVL
jgi:C4-type Zn-finger protein